MTENVTIRMGADASQALREIDKVRKKAGGLRESFMGFRAGLGIAGGFFGVNVIREILDPVKEGFLESTKTAASFNFALEAATKGLYAFGVALGSAVGGKAFEAVFDAVLRNMIPGMVGIGTLSRIYGYTSQNEQLSQLLTGKQYTSPASQQFVVKPDNESARRQRALVDYARGTEQVLIRMERDMATQQWTDPW